MALIGPKDTKPERIVREAVWRAGLRYRLHVATLPGKPDLVFPALRTVVFVHGCYWHAHACQKGRIPALNRGFWADKFATNKARDARNRARLRRQGWKVIMVWECSLATVVRRRKALSKLLEVLKQARQDARRG